MYELLANYLVLDFEKDELTWALFKNVPDLFFEKNERLIKKILAKIRNYNAHFFYSDSVFQANDNILKLLNKNYLVNSLLSKVTIYFDELLKKTQATQGIPCTNNKCCGNAKNKMPKWSFMFFTASILLYHSEYTNLKTQILIFLKKQKEKETECRCFIETLQIFQDNLDFFENKLGIKILEKASIFEAKDVFILNEITEIIKHNHDIFKKFQLQKKDETEIKTTLSLNNLVKIIDAIVDFDQNQHNYKIKTKISEKLYCMDCKNSNKCDLLAKEDKRFKTLKSKNCAKCNRYWNQETKKYSWYIEKPTYQILKNVWRFHIIYPKENVPSQIEKTKVVFISKKILQKFLLWIFWYNLRSGSLERRVALTPYIRKVEKLVEDLLNKNKKDPKPSVKT